MPISENTLFTSIPPRTRRPIHGRDFGPAWQTACIESWREAGFRVVSLNAPEELETVRVLAPGIDFKTLKKGRTRPFLTDFFDAAANSESKIVGIINADCMMIPPFAFTKHLKDQIDGIAIAERIDLSKETLRPTGIRLRGFDAFFFDATAAATIARDDHWQIGGVWGDYWLPFAFHLAGFKVKTLPAPILLHLEHDLAWDWSGIERQAPRLINFLRANDSGHLDPELAAELSKKVKLDSSEIWRLQVVLFNWLQSREPLWRPQVGSGEDLMMGVFNALATIPQPPESLYRSLIRWKRARVRSVRALLARVINRLGLRPALYKLGFVKRREISS